jgi:type IV pilus assembly protein PilM
MALGTAPKIGLDIGSSAVRAAWVTGGRGGRSLVRFGQVALPPGAVEGGEIRDPEVVTEAVAQLWKRSKLKSKSAVVGVANQRVVVRQIDLPYMEEKELRSSIKFQVADHIPMPVEDAELDFEVLDDYMSDDEQHMMRILLVAAASDMVESYLSVVTGAGLSPAGVDVTPFAVARAVSQVARGETGVAGAEAVIDIGAGVTNILVHHNAEVRFVRILLVGGDDATTSLAEALDIPFEEAEAIKLDLVRGVGSEETRKVVDRHVESLVREIQGSIDYYLSLEDSEPVASVVVTGGGSLTTGLVQKLEASLGTEIYRSTALTEMNVSKSGLTGEQLAQIEPVSAAAVGLAMGVSSK